MLMNAGFAELSGLAGAVGTKTAFSALAYGTSATAVAATQTALVAESQRAAATVTQVTIAVTDDTLQLTKTFTIAGTETIREVGILNNATTGGTMLARYLLPTPRDVVAADSFVLTYKVQFASA